MEHTEDYELDEEYDEPKYIKKYADTKTDEENKQPVTTSTENQTPLEPNNFDIKALEKQLKSLPRNKLEKMMSTLETMTQDSTATPKDKLRQKMKEKQMRRTSKNVLAYNLQKQTQPAKK